MTVPANPPKQSLPRPSAREAANQKRQLRKQQEALFKDLLSVVDTLDRASEHWQQAKENHASKGADSRTNKLSLWQRLTRFLGASSQQTSAEQASADLLETVTSAQEGIDLIRDTMLGVLDKHQVVPLVAKGELFDPETMHALGQEMSPAVPPNTVVKEIVRGYCWKDRILREAQVIVAGRAEEENL